MALYSSLEAVTGLYWCAALDASERRPLGMQRLIIYATPSADPARARIAAAAKHHIATMAQRPKESTNV